MTDGLTVPVIEGTLRAHNVKLPAAAQKASGICILGRTIRSVIYTTDIAVIRNCDADAVFAVYPFTPQQIIAKQIIEASSIPVFAGVGGGTTNGPRSARLAHDAEGDGAYGVVLNAPASYTTLEMVSRSVDIPVICTVVDGNLDVVANRIDAGASIINVSGGRRTAEYVRGIRSVFPSVPILATGGKTEESIEETVAAGANAIICTPPSNAEIFSSMMTRYRESAEIGASNIAVRPISEASKREIEKKLHDIHLQGYLQ